MGGIGPILAYVFSRLDGKHFPDKNKFLSPEQTALVLRRIEEDRGDSIPDEITRSKVFKHLGDWTLWSYGSSPCSLQSFGMQ
ncbi:hypothetical protein C0991_011311 [Blastosporella zonata]|nr:hypothetical protein C0991_011311 [Blastosporella zonata]